MSYFTEKLYNFFTSFYLFKYLFITILIFSNGFNSNNLSLIFEENAKLLSIERGE